MKKILEQLLKANTAREVTDILVDLTDNHEIKWEAVGGRGNRRIFSIKSCGGENYSLYILNKKSCEQINTSLGSPISKS